MAHLGKNLGLLEALSLGVGSMIGAGIFVLSGIAAQSAGPAASVSFAFAGGAVLLTALSFAEMATAMPSAGGPYVYVKEAFGPFWGFFVGWSLWVGLALATAFYASGFVRYLLFLAPQLDLSVTHWSVGLALLLINLIGSRSSGRLQTGIVFPLLFILGIYIVLGWSKIDPTLHQPFLPYGWEPVFDSAATVFVSFLGFELIVTAAEEMKEPRRDLPLATLSSVVIVTCIYVLVMHVATGLVSHFDLGETPTPLADTAQRIIGPRGAVFIVVAGLLATLSSANASIMASSRVGWAMSRDRMLPSFLGAVHPRWHSPHLAVITTGALVLVALTPQNSEWLAEAAGFLHLYPFFIVNMALIKLRGRPGYHPTFRVPGGPTLPVLACFTTLVLLFKVHPEDMLWGLLLVLPGVLYRAAATGRTPPRWRHLLPWA